MALYLEGDYLGRFIYYTTNNITGSEVITLLLILLGILVLMILFKFPIELYAIFILPVLMVFALYNAVFMPLLALDIIILAFFMYYAIFT
jgi:hypothetical protein